MGMTIKSLIIASLLVGAVLIGCMQFMTGLKTGYPDNNIDMTGFNVTERNMDEQMNTINNMSERIQGLTFSLNPIDLFGYSKDMVVLGWQSFTLVFRSHTSMAEMVGELNSNMSESLPIPAWIVPVAMSMILVTIIIIALEIFFRWKLKED